jgi:hypothetical protein
MTLILQPIGCPIVFLRRIIPKPVIRCLRLCSLPGRIYWDSRGVFGLIIQDEFHIEGWNTGARQAFLPEMTGTNYRFVSRVDRSHTPFFETHVPGSSSLAPYSFFVKVHVSVPKQPDNVLL